jgi:hypothetical protein
MASGVGAFAGAAAAASVGGAGAGAGAAAGTGPIFAAASPFVPSTRMGAWHCLHFTVTTRPLIFCSKTSSEMEKLFPHAGHVTGSGIHGLAYTLSPQMTQFSARLAARLASFCDAESP